MSSPDGLNPSRLGTKKHWDDVYATELVNFEEIGDEGEIWFGEDSVEKMVDWAEENVPKDPSPSIVEVGTGNGTLLFALHDAGYDPSHILGVDYSADAVKLARSIGSSRVQGAELISFRECDFLQQFPEGLAATADQTVAGVPTWDLVLDKGTFDAIALAEPDETGKPPAADYPRRIGQIVKPGGFFLITSCNFTEEELKEKFASGATGLQYHSRIKFPSFSFGGKQGNVYSSVAFQKPA